jgi:16S rRNA (cytidine1402-2'-O)-methyltransferase
MGDMSLRAIDVLGKLDAVACEDTRESGKLLAAYDITVDKFSYHDHNAAEVRPKIIEMIRDGLAVGLVSDAGMPLISDPGYKLVEAVVAEGMTVTCVPGASASLAALVLSGLPSDRFFFHGFLPPKSSARKSALDGIKAVPGTLIFYETAPRLAESLSDMAEILGDRPAAVARELTKKFEEVRRGTLRMLASHYGSAGAPRGEIVVVVGAPLADAADSWTDEKVTALLTDMMEQEGMSVKDAAAFVASRSGFKKSDVYQTALLLKNRKDT